MSRLHPFSLFVFPALALAVVAADTSAGLPLELQGRPPVTRQTKLELIRLLNAEFAFARRLFPRGEKGLEITSSGQITPDDHTVVMQVANFGPAARPGDRVQITDVVFKDHSMVFELNGGPKKKGHWYDHIQVGGSGGMTNVHQEKNANAKGSYLGLVFPKYVPEMTAAEVRKLLEPVFDFSVKSATQAYLDTLPPKLKDSIQKHQALVGMNKDMVMEALGRPPKRIREREGTAEYEEWIYGEPPGDVQFVRFVNEEVVRVEHIQVGGEKVVKTAREVNVNPVTGAATMVDLNAPTSASAAAGAKGSPTISASTDNTAAPTPAVQARKPAKPPTMRREGEQPELDSYGKPAGKDDPQWGTKPMPTPSSQPEPEWGTKPASSGPSTQSGSTSPSGSSSDQTQPPKH